MNPLADLFRPDFWSAPREVRLALCVAVLWASADAPDAIDARSALTSPNPNVRIIKQTPDPSATGTDGMSDGDYSVMGGIARVPNGRLDFTGFAPSVVLSSTG